VYIMLTPFIM
jgi:hypothetical protein